MKEMRGNEGNAGNGNFDYFLYKWMKLRIQDLYLREERAHFPFRASGLAMNFLRSVFAGKKGDEILEGRFYTLTSRHQQWTCL
jgi:hypothetical protein